ncbi:hypothetical protein [Lignipirellula cremea]|nr:hypothetical protein [Lignipirellula cremea]
MTDDPHIPQRAELEERYQAKIITYEKGGVHLPGGMCRCCGCGPNVEPDYQSEPWYIYKANLCDTDGVFYSMLCQECLEEVRQEYNLRPKTTRDEMAKEIGDLLGDDIDGAQSMMDDFEGFDFD